MIEVEEARQYYTDCDAAHDFDHVLRVLALAERIGQAEGAAMEIVRAAALLHDVARAEEERTGACHAKVGAEQARQILAGHPADKVEAVAQAIASHRFRSNEVVPQTLEAKVLYDADKLDAIGAIGIARAYALADEASGSGRKPRPARWLNHSPPIIPRFTSSPSSSPSSRTHSSRPPPAR